MSAQLTSEMIQAGEDLIRALDRHKFSARTALWLYTEEHDRWRLVIATTHRRLMGARKSYKAVDKVLSEIDTPIDLSSVSLVDTKDRMIKGLAAPFPTRAAARGFRLSHAIIAGRVIDDAYIYRLAG